MLESALQAGLISAHYVKLAGLFSQRIFLTSTYSGQFGVV